MVLTAIQAKNAKATDSPLKLSDGGGLFLLVQPNGAKYWRLAYRFAGKQKTLALGVYPQVSLADARDKRDEARKLLAADVDPSESRKAVKSSRLNQHANSFEAVAREWHVSKSPAWAPSHTDKVIHLLQKDIFPWLGARPIATITAPEILKAVRRIEERGAVDTARRALLNCGQVFRYAVSTGRVERDPVPDLRGALKSVKPVHRAANTNPQFLGQLLKSIDNYHGSFITKCALRLAPLVFVRPGELRAAEWSEINLDKAEWNIPAVRMKMREPHLVPLSVQSIDVLRDIQEVTSNGRYVFPSELTHTRPMSENTVLFALRRMGFAKEEITGHGFRAIARTLLDEALNIRPDYIEHQLAHAVRDPNGRAYNRTAHLEERRKMMQLWADYLDALKASFSKYS